MQSEFLEPAWPLVLLLELGSLDRAYDQVKLKSMSEAVGLGSLDLALSMVKQKSASKGIWRL